MSRFWQNVGDRLSRVDWRKVGTVTTIAGAIVTAIGGIAAAKSQSQQIDMAVTRELNRRLNPPIEG